MNYVTGKIIKELREERQITQKQLADSLHISDKTVSKWETGRGLPDISLIGELAGELGVSVVELLLGEVTENQNRSGNMKKLQFYVCPVCGNVIWSMGEGTYSCCGILLPPALVEEQDENHIIIVTDLDGEYYIQMKHPMAKEHSISFVAYVTSNRCEIVKMYPEQNMECRFQRKGHGMLYAYCNRHGLFRVVI